MKKFEYNLQRILSIKERKEELLKLELSRLLFKKTQHEKVKEYYEELLIKEYEKIRHTEKFKPEDYIRAGRYADSIRQQIYNQVLMIHEYDIKIDAKREEIKQNRKEIKTLEKLKEKRWEEYQYELMQDERRIMDEIANRLFFSKAR